MKKLAILGDSYSTYEGYIPDDYQCWYSKSGNALQNDVNDVSDVWWKLLMEEKQMELVANCSYSGSTVCYTGYPDYDGVKTSFVYRMNREFGNLNNRGDVPDIIIIFGGTNDFFNQSPIGEICYGRQESSDLLYFAPAFCNIVEYMIQNFPQSRILTVINDDITSLIRDVEREVSRHYQVEYIELKHIDKQNGHPSKLGMRQIAIQIGSRIG
ncbi:MAG: SGNH/GDSL hydrolase family protein [Oliverpabstia sp.]